MLQSLAQQLREQLENELDLLRAEESDPMQRVTQSIHKARSALEALREGIIKYPFKSSSDEIHFFKHTKPRFYAYQFFYCHVYLLDDNCPCGTQEMLQAYYEQELNAIKRCFLQHHFFYEYYRKGMKELDEIYFLRGVESPSLPLPEVSALDPEFSTYGDYLFSKFIALERLVKEILFRITTLDNAPVVSPDGKLAERNRLKWTGESINLVELGYGLYHSGQLNNGNASIAEIFRWLEGQLGVSIGKPSRRLTEIKRRKRLSQTRYLDQMRDQLLKRIDDEDAYLP